MSAGSPDQHDTQSTLNVCSELTKFQSKAKTPDILVCLGDLIMDNSVIILLLLGVKIRTPGPKQGSPPCVGWLGKETGYLAAQ